MFVGWATKIGKTLFRVNPIFSKKHSKGITKGIQTRKVMKQLDEFLKTVSWGQIPNVVIADFSKAHGTVDCQLLVTKLH